MAQRADIAGPIVTGEQHGKIGRHLGQGLAVFFGVKRQIMPEQQRHILATFAQRRQQDLDGVEAKQQVGAESPFIAEHRRRHVGRCDDPDIERHAAVAADRRYPALFERGQQLGLQVQRQVADFIEEDGAAIGRLEASDAIGTSIGEGTLHIAEQFRIEQAFGDGAEVYRQEGLAGAP